MIVDFFADYIYKHIINTMCKFSSGCGSSDSFPCKSCGTPLCKQCSRSLKTGNPPSSGNAAQCGDCKKNFRWFSDYLSTKILNNNLFFAGV